MHVKTWRLNAGSLSFYARLFQLTCLVTAPKQNAKTLFDSCPTLQLLVWAPRVSVGTWEPPLLQAHFMNEVSVLTGNKKRTEPPAPRSQDEKELGDVLPLAHLLNICLTARCCARRQMCTDERPLIYMYLLPLGLENTWPFASAFQRPYNSLSSWTILM